MLIDLLTQAQDNEQAAKHVAALLAQNPPEAQAQLLLAIVLEREGRLLGELLRAGDIGYELSLDPISPIVVGVYPMRPVTRV